MVRNRRLPLQIKPLPGGYAIRYADGRRALAQEIARLLTQAWSG